MLWCSPFATRHWVSASDAVARPRLRPVLSGARVRRRDAWDRGSPRCRSTPAGRPPVPASGTRRRSLRDLFVADEIFSAPGAFALRLGRAARLLLLLRALGFFLAHGWRHLRARAGRRAKAGNEGPAARPLAEPLRGRRQVAVGISRQEGLVRRHRVERG